MKQEELALKNKGWHQFSWIVSVGCLMAGLILSGCGKKEENTGNYPNGEVKVYNWGEYIDEDLIGQFEEEYGIKVIYDTFTTNEEMFPKLQADTSMYDVVCPSDYMIEKMIQNDMVQPVDKSKIENYKNIGTAYLKKMEELIREINMQFHIHGERWGSFIIHPWFMRRWTVGIFCGMMHMKMKS